MKRFRSSLNGFPDDFADMAAAGRTSRDDAATQLALVYADGNQVGAFLHTIAHLDDTDRILKREIVAAIDEATLDALAQAVVETFRDEPLASRPPVLAHVAGGDDLMVSVPAPFAWRFTMALLGGFQGEMSIRAQRWGLAPREVVTPSLSAGVVFHHYSHPFSDVVALATQQLKTAKDAVAGRESSVAFVDLTADGDRPVLRRPVRTLAWLQANDGMLAELAAVSGSHRQAVVALHRHGHKEPTSDEQRGETAVQAMARRVADLGVRALWAPVAGADATADEVRDRLLSEPTARDELRHLLDLSRWWQAPNSVPRADGGRT